MTKPARSYRIATIGGDGIGPEVVCESLKVLRRVAEIEGFGVDVTEYPFGAEHYLKTNEALPARFLEDVKRFDAVLLGAIGDPRLEVGMLERAIISGLRFGLDLYVNLRPVKLYAEHLCPLKGKRDADIDFVVVRENTEDVYTGIGGIFRKGTPEEVAIAEMIFTRRGTERVIRYAFELCRAQGRKKVTMVDKANAIRAMDLWTRTFEEVGAEYPEIERAHFYVDAAAMQMVRNPEGFDVVVVSNMFGDILTDLGAMITGGLGIAASGNIHPGRVSMFEPVHGSAPKYAGKGVASPLATILSVSLLLDHIGEKSAAQRVEGALAGLLASGKIASLGTNSGISTSQAGDWVVEALEAGSAARR
jgi:3-isopropylmalate dehydrogenase